MVFPLAPTYANAISVKLPELDTFWNETDDEITVFSGIRFGSDGKIYRQTPAGNWQWTGQSWLITGAASSYYLVRSITSGSALGTDGGTLQQMNANRDYSISTTLEKKTTDIEFSIADDSLGSNILVTRTYQLNCERVYNPTQDDQFTTPGWKSSTQKR